MLINLNSNDVPCFDDNLASFNIVGTRETILRVFAVPFDFAGLMATMGDRTQQGLYGMFPQTAARYSGVPAVGYRSLNVPLNRLEQESPSFAIGRSTEINRDELKFQKFIDRLRQRFAHLFLSITKKQLLMKGVITDEDWDKWKNDISVDFL